MQQQTKRPGASGHATGAKDARIVGTTKSNRENSETGSQAQGAGTAARGDPFTKVKLDRLGALVTNKRVGHLAFRAAFDIVITYMNRKSGSAWPGQKKLAADLGVSDRAIRYSLDELKAERFFDITRRKGKSSVFAFPDRKQASAQGDVQIGSGLPLDRKQASAPPRKQVADRTLKSEPTEEPCESRARESHTRKSVFGRKMPAVWPTQQDKEWAVQNWTSAGRSDLAERVDDLAASCRDYYIAQGSVFKDWSATWRNWVRREVNLTKANSQPNATGGMSAARGIFRQVLKDQPHANGDD